ncbi:CRISPR-associated helicase Cas3' [Streptomyces sp. NPDC003077]|uniref:CRISPR-associated helicase Cas3' n=1 Tax=Streptomyces sp. NPDC003077 TaxID=3154443 RepID=UPI0033B683F3
MMKREDVGGSGLVVDTCMWGKQKGLPRPYPVVCHLLDTAAVFLALWDVVVGARMRERIAGALGLSAEETRAVLAFWAGLHDLGKISPPFQVQVPEAFAAVREDPVYRCAPGAEAERGFRHEMATHWAVAELLAEAGYPGHRRVKAAVSHQVAQLLGGHHGRFGVALKAQQLAAPSAYQPGLGEEGWAAQRRVHFAELRRVVGAGAVPVGGLPAELAVVVAGLVVVADWLASQEKAIVPLLPPSGWAGAPAELDEHWRRARAAAQGLVREARLGRAEFTADRFEDMFPFAPNLLQRDLVEGLPRLVGERGSGLVLVTAPTGDGKTEAALFAASVLGRAAGARGLYFALPTMATADGMFPRVAEFAGRALGGERALTLLHSMARLSPVYAGPDADTGADAGDEGESAGGVVAGRATAVEAGQWLRGPKRGLLAPLGVGTVDQALAAVLPLVHNALRLFGLSEKVFVVDEAHAYGPWMHQLLTRLLEWLGAMGAPVVLLSATLTGRVATSLVDAYRRGAGFVEPSRVEPCYPGWLFVDAGTGEVSAPRATGSARERTVRVEVHQVAWDVDEQPDAVVVSGGRREALREVLRSVAEEGGTALVCCTTVAEAQRTYRDLCGAFPALAGTEGGVRLLHSRYPAGVRQRIAAECEAAYGKPGGPEEVARARPGSILVATQVVEQSLDLDFDLVVSDLAPLAQLLQRAGRGCRHERGASGRPGWAGDEDEPRLVVLEPVDRKKVTQVPQSWGTVYDPGLLHRTARLLRTRVAGGIAVPGDVQELVDAVYAPEFVEDLAGAAREELRRMDAEREARQMVERQQASMVEICAPADVAGDLYALSVHEAGVTEELLTTRLGADGRRVLCLYEQPDGALTLDEAGAVPLPRGGGNGPSRKELVQILRGVAPVPGSWLPGEAAGEPAPAGWAKQPLLREVVLLRMRPAGDGAWACVLGQQTIRVSPVGLEAAP